MGGGWKVCVPTWLACLLHLLAVVNAAKILLLPMQTYSNCVEMSAIGEELHKRGHNVTIVIMSNFNDRKCHGGNGVRPVRFKAPAGPSAPKPPEKVTDQATDLLKDGDEVSYSKHTEMMKQMIDYHCSITISDTRMWKHFKAEKFDFAIVEGSYYCYCLFMIPFKLRIPYAAYSSAFEDYILNKPFLPSLSPDPFSEYSDSMSFFQRVRNTYRQISTHISVRLAIPSNVITKAAPELSTSTLIHLVANSELFLQNADPLLGYSLPSMPNHVYVGGVTALPAKPLPPDLHEYYKNAKLGIVIMSLGSTFKDLPMPLKHKLLRVLYKLNVPVLWKYMQESDNRNVRTVKWFPQNDLLGHPKTRLLISHCGSNSIFEALYHGVPMICIPLHGSHFFNSVRVQKWQVGEKVSLLHTSEDQMFSTISYVLHNISFKANMKRAADIFHSRPDKPLERAAVWIEHVIRFSGKHLRSRATDMSVFTLLGYDVFLLFSLLFVGFQCLLYKLFRLIQDQWLAWKEKKQKNN